MDLKFNKLELFFFGKVSPQRDDESFKEYFNRSSLDFGSYFLMLLAVISLSVKVLRKGVE